jgi:hypothetical protein
MLTELACVRSSCSSEGVRTGWLIQPNVLAVDGYGCIQNEEDILLSGPGEVMSLLNS